MFDMVEYGKVLGLKEMMSQGWMNAHKVLNPEMSDLMEFEDYKTFAKIMDKSEYDSIKLQVDKIKLEIKNSIILIEITKWNKTSKRRFEISLEEDKNDYTKKQLLEKMFPRMRSIIPMISNKIMKEQLRKALNNS